MTLLAPLLTTANAADVTTAVTSTTAIITTSPTLPSIRLLLYVRVGLTATLMSSRWTIRIVGIITTIIRWVTVRIVTVIIPSCCGMMGGGMLVGLAVGGDDCGMPFLKEDLDDTDRRLRNDAAALSALSRSI